MVSPKKNAPRAGKPHSKINSPQQRQEVNNMSIDRVVLRAAVGIVVLLAVIAFALRTDEVVSTASIEVPASPDVVWEILTDTSLKSEWMEFVTGATQMVGASGTAASSTMLSVYQEGRMSNIYEDVVVSAAPLLLQTQIGDREGVIQVATRYELKPAGPGGTRTRLNITATRALEGTLAPFFAFFVSQRSDDNVTHNAQALQQLIIQQTQEGR
jgi:carbon monoxide dehydrogenase subunit G